MTNANTIQTSKQNGNPHELSCHKILYDSQYVVGTKQCCSQDIIQPSQNVAGTKVKLVPKDSLLEFIYGHQVIWYQVTMVTFSKRLL